MPKVKKVKLSSILGGGGSYYAICMQAGSGAS